MDGLGAIKNAWNAAQALECVSGVLMKAMRWAGYLSTVALLLAATACGDKEPQRHILLRDLAKGQHCLLDRNR
jgi:hypothetical protein